MLNDETNIGKRNLPQNLISDLPNQTLANFYDIADTNRGGIGEIFFCQDKVTKEFCVLKTFQEKGLSYMELFEKEAAFALSLERHPNIVYTETIEKNEHKYYMVMEFIGKKPKRLQEKVKGHTLVNEFNKNKEIPLKTVIKWALEFCEGMEYLLSKGMTAHKDIKPSNLFITEDGILKIGDFGLVSLINKCGTPGYRAPEYNKKLDIRSDIYSFGLVLYQMVNHYNLENETKIITHNNIISQDESKEEFINPSEINSKYLTDIIKKCLQFEPEKRYQTIAELKTDLLKEAQKINLDFTRPNIAPMSAQDYGLKGYGFSNLSKNQLSIAYLNEAIEMNPKNPVNYYNRGIIKMGMKLDGILEDFDKAIELGLQTPEIYNNRGIIKSVILKQYEEAIKDFDKAIKIDNQNIRAYINRGIVKLELGRYKEMLKDFYKAIKLNAKLAFFLLYFTFERRISKMI